MVDVDPDRRRAGSGRHEPRRAALGTGGKAVVLLVVFTVALFLAGTRTARAASSALDPHGSVAHTVADLSRVMFAIALAVFAVVGIHVLR
jgi:hypothetical protein